MKPRAVVFDAYDTLFDVHAVVTQESGIEGDLRPRSELRRQLDSNKRNRTFPEWLVNALAVPAAGLFWLLLRSGAPLNLTTLGARLERSRDCCR